MVVKTNKWSDKLSAWFYHQGWTNFKRDEPTLWAHDLVHIWIIVPGWCNSETYLSPKWMKMRPGKNILHGVPTDLYTFTQMNGMLMLAQNGPEPVSSIRTICSMLLKGAENLRSVTNHSESKFSVFYRHR